MWSDRYYYLNIYKDKSLNTHCSTERLIYFLNDFPELQQKEMYRFGNADGLPFVDMWLLFTPTLSSWSNYSTDPIKTNLISIVCAKGVYGRWELLQPIFVKIASYLHWSLVDEETDGGQEDFILWKP
ncbi:MAG: hypothetical protein ACFB10_19760 [Salibacteraceae bacterium]